MNIVNMNLPLIRAYRATVAYDGSDFSGSQIQKNGRSVMGEINKALSRVLNHPVRVKASSRTDSGVHATGQVISFRTSAPRTAEEILRALNGMLPGDVRLTDVRETGLDFHARYSSVGKIYLYRILRAESLPPMSRNYVLFIERHKPFDIDLMRKASEMLEGKRDFRSFSPRLLDGENPVKNIRRIVVTEDEPLIEIRFAGSGFLYQMVRRMTGILIAVVQGRESIDSLSDALENPLKGKIRYNADPRGLFLEKVLYSNEEMALEISKMEG